MINNINSFCSSVVFYSVPAQVKRKQNFDLCNAITKIVKRALIPLALVFFLRGADGSTVAPINNWYRGPLPDSCFSLQSAHNPLYNEDWTCPLASSFPEKMQSIYTSPSFQELATPEFLCPIDGPNVPARSDYHYYSISDYHYYSHHELLANSELFYTYSNISDMQESLMQMCERAKDRIECFSPQHLLYMASFGRIDSKQLTGVCHQTFTGEECTLGERLFYSLNHLNFYKPGDTKKVTWIASVSPENDYNGAFDIHYPSFATLTTWKRVSTVYPIIFSTIHSKDDYQNKLDLLQLHDFVVKVHLVRFHGNPRVLQISKNDVLHENNFLNPKATPFAEHASIILESCSTGEILGMYNNMVQLWAKTFPGTIVTGSTKKSNQETTYAADAFGNRFMFYILQGGKDVSFSQFCVPAFIDDNGLIIQDCCEMRKTYAITAHLGWTCT